MTWLTGSWQGTYKGKPFYEAWQKATPNILVNFSIEIKGKDTVIKEETAILITDSNVLLGKKPAQWTLKRITTNEMVFENDTLKFSNQIIWLHTDDDHWFTILQNPKSTVQYDMIRVPELEAVVDRFIAKHNPDKKN